MEPLSTLVLVAAFLAPVPLTKRPDWVVDSCVSNQSVGVVGTNTNQLVSAPMVETESILMSPPLSMVLDRRVLLAQEIQTYKFLKNGWDGKGSVSAFPESMAAAMQFVEQLPGGLPLPGAMLSSSGEVGFYWDIQGGYADLSFASDGLGSFFSRTHEGQEYFQEALAVESLTREWFFHVLGAMTAPKMEAA